MGLYNADHGPWNQLYSVTAFFLIAAFNRFNTIFAAEHQKNILYQTPDSEE